MDAAPPYNRGVVSEPAALQPASAPVTRKPQTLPIAVAEHRAPRSCALRMRRRSPMPRRLAVISCSWPMTRCSMRQRLQGLACFAKFPCTVRPLAIRCSPGIPSGSSTRLKARSFAICPTATPRSIGGRRS